MNKRIFGTLICVIYIILPTLLSGQTYRDKIENDTTIIKSDTLKGTSITARQKSNYIPKGKTLRTEVISTAGLHKMACCNLAESFENSSSVTVGYSDATTGARQIRLLGLSGIYTQMLDENRPIMRTFSAPWGLTFIPGSWMESIQIAKGSTSVIDGAESITGQINIEHKRSTDEKPLFINGSVMSDSRTDLNVISSLQLNDALSTTILTHADANFRTHDSNHDGFIDEPKSKQVSFANRWLYYSNNLKIHWGIRGIYDNRKGGMDGYDRKTYTTTIGKPWGTNICNNNFNGYFKIGRFLGESQTSSIALVADYTYHKLESYFGESKYFGKSNSIYTNLIYRNEFTHSHDLTIGVSGNIDKLSDEYKRKILVSNSLLESAFNDSKTLSNAGLYSEYTYRIDEKFSSIIGIRGDWYSKDDFEFIPRLTLKYKPTDYIVFRANGGRGIRYTLPISDNIGILSTNKEIIGDLNQTYKEDAFTYGGNVTFYLPIDKKESTYLSFDFFRTEIKNQLIADYDLLPNSIVLYQSDKNSYTNNFQIDFNSEPFERFSIATTFRFSEAKFNKQLNIGNKNNTEKVDKPLVSKFKGVLNLQYKTNMNKWVFDFTASLYGPSKVYNFMKSLKKEDGSLIYPKGKTPTYLMLFAQITRHFKGFDIYLGCENITNYKQKYPILGDKDSHGYINPVSNSFDASAIWGPLMGIKFDVGFRLTIWKKR